MTGRFKLYKDKSGEWRWRFVAKNGETIAESSESYVDRRDAVKAIKLVLDAGRASAADLIDDE